MKAVVKILLVFCTTCSVADAAIKLTRGTRSKTISCEAYLPTLSWLIEHIKKNYESKDVSYQVGQVQNLVQECNFDLSRFHVMPGILDIWKEIGHEAELDRAKKKIEHFSQYGEVDSLLRIYRANASALGHKAQDIDAYERRYSAQGKIATQIEKEKCQPDYDWRGDRLGDVRDQGSTGWCYAFVAADLLSYKLGKRISAADIAINYNDTLTNYLKMIAGKNEHDFMGGFMDDAIRIIARKGGACLEDNFKSEDNGDSSLKSMLIELEETKKMFNLPNLRTCPTAVKTLFPTLSTSEYMQIAFSATRWNLIKRLDNKACQPRLPLDGIKLKSYLSSTLNPGGKKYDGSLSMNQFFDQIDNQLAKKNVVSIAYNGNSLAALDSEEYSGHASIIVGRRYNPKRRTCEYLLRNSWGRGSNGYDWRLDQEEGHVWMPKSVLANSLQVITYLE